MLKTERNSNPIYKFFKSVICNPVLMYTVLIMMTIMYHYRSSLTFVYGIISLIIGAAVFKIFDYICKHRFLGIIIYIAVFFAFILSVGICVEIGSQSYPISFALWFFSPQDTLDYSSWYTLAIFLVFMLFMSSVIYYFTRVRYRIFMNFLIFIIPFVLYGKEYEKMPTIFIILMAVGYVFIMIYFRQITVNEKAVVVSNSSIWKSVGVYVVLFSSIAAMLPKPYVKANRTALEELISAEEFTDRLNAALNVFRDTTTSNNFRSFNNDSVLYYAYSDNELRLKTMTYTSYDYKTDSWSTSDNDRFYKYTNEEKEIEQYQAPEFLQAINKAVDLDPSIADKYEISAFSDNELFIPDKNRLEIYTMSSGAQFAPVPTSMTELVSSSYKKKIALISSGLVYCDDGRFLDEERFKFEYYNDRFYMNPGNRRIIDSLSINDYMDFVYDCSNALAIEDPDAFDILYEFYSEYRSANNYLDYGNNSYISELAEKITDDLETDYDKAQAIESYFSREGFVYDSKFRKDSGDSAVEFLRDDKRGVCYEFATAMVLLSRAAGIPARYVEGYNMSERYADNANYFVIRSKHAHGFPELYIRGAGWVSFEPTVPDLSDSEMDQRKTSLTLSYAGLLIFAAALLLLLFIKMYPTLSHKLFIRKLKNTKPDEAVILIVQRIRKLCKISPTQTSNEASNEIFIAINIDISEVINLFDSVIYGRLDLTEDNKKTAFDCYISVYERLREIKKSKRKIAKKMK